MLAAQVVALLRDLEADGVPVWVAGGWGVDALLGRQTRPHHDLDLLVDVRSTARLRAHLDRAGLPLAHLWDESRPLPGDAGPSAYVHAAPDGREVDVHVVEVHDDGAVEALWTTPWPLPPDALDGRGTVEGEPVRCLSVGLQRLAHTGYALPDAHRQDLRLLDEAFPQG